jgi:hypothetical protein
VDPTNTVNALMRIASGGLVLQEAAEEAEEHVACLSPHATGAKVATVGRMGSFFLYAAGRPSRKANPIATGGARSCRALRRGRSKPAPLRPYRAFARGKSRCFFGFAGARRGSCRVAILSRPPLGHS